jgi:hypothetical protein
MKCVCYSLAILGMTATASAGDTPSAKANPTDRLAAIQKDRKEAVAHYDKARAALADTPERNEKAQELRKALDKKQAKLFAAAVELAREDPKSDGALSALEWVLTIPRAYYLPAGKAAMQLATEHIAANPKAGKIVAYVGAYLPDERFNREEHDAAMAFIKAVLAKNPSRAARGQAAIAIAAQLKGRFAEAEYKKTSDVDRRAADAEKAFAVVARDYADCPRLLREKGPKLGEIARRNLFELRNLRIGRIAPDIEGDDLEGVKFKLSDYRKKVVVIDFWGDW